MSTPEVLDIELTSEPQQLPKVRKRLQKWLGALGWAEQEMTEIILAVDEALTNVIRHGYQGRGGQKILLSGRTIRDRRRGPGLEICVRDFGRQVDPGQICGRDLEDIRPGGLGVHMIRALTDSACYSRADGGGMQLVMQKYKCGATDAGNPRAGQK
ncbi:MAG: ATP-binding protein [Planctomycetes bacterium]|nr:ATP-binding protein [Planctomycetota bacterium]